MALETMYEGLPFSPQTTLTNAISEVETVIPVADVSVFPDAPNYATIAGNDGDGETILYTAKTGSALSGCTRGVEGTAKRWDSGEIISRNWTAKDHNVLIANLKALDQLLTNIQDGIPTKLADLTDDATHRLVTDTEKQTWNGKSNFSGSYDDLTGKPDLFSGDYNDLTGKPSIPTRLSQLSGDATHRVVTDAEKSTWNNKSDFDGNYNNLANKPSIPTVSSSVSSPSTTTAASSSAVKQAYDKAAAAMPKTGGTFTGTIKAGGSYQSYSTSLLRNSKLVSTDTTPSVNGEINWTYG